MVKNPYIGMPIAITDWEDTPCEGCSAGGSGRDNSPASGNTGGSAGNDNNWQNDGTFDSMYLGSLPIACLLYTSHYKQFFHLLLLSLFGIFRLMPVISLGKCENIIQYLSVAPGSRYI